MTDQPATAQDETVTDTPWDDLTVRPSIDERIELASEVPGLSLVHFINEILVGQAGAGAPVDGRWSVTHSASSMAIQSCTLGFRTLHAAAHFAKRLDGLIDWSVPAGELKELGALGGDFVKAVRHAEAHAHEVDATWPAGAVMPFSNGPSIIDESGMTRRFIAQAPTLDFDTDDEGYRVCSECGDVAIVAYGF